MVEREKREDCKWEQREYRDIEKRQKGNEFTI